MTSIEQLKQELLTQKSAIETKGGVVNVANTNPSPAEITAGINAIPIPDFSTATAAEGDVIKGKTFYAANNSLKTGTLEAFSATEMEILFNNSADEPISTKLNYYVPQNTTKLRDYFMCHSKSTLDVYLNEQLQEIGDHSFENCSNFTIKNFTTATNLHTIGERGLQGVPTIDLTNIPSCITTLKHNAFSDIVKKGKSIIVPPNVTSYGNYCFAASDTNVRLLCDSVDFSQFVNSTLGNGMFMGVIFDCDFTTPSCVTEIPQYFNFVGSFDHITITSNITKVGQYSFASVNGEPAEYNKLKSATFLGETPPTFAYLPFGDKRYRANTKIYVPDQSIDAYKAATNFATYASLIYPVSQKP